MTKQTSELISGVFWVVVADASRAKIYSRQQRRGQMELVQSLAEPAARAKQGDFDADAPGRSFDSQGDGRHAMEPDHTAKEHLRETFAHEIAAVLESARNNHRIEQLVVVAAPAMLGALRTQFSDATRKLVVTEISKDVTNEEPAVIAALIDAHS
jgi:protein required for attachment to host cells